jgi:hypothetical protein
VNLVRKRGGPHHSVIFVNLAQIQPNSAKYRGFGSPDWHVTKGLRSEVRPALTCKTGSERHGQTPAYPNSLPAAVCPFRAT